MENCPLWLAGVLVSVLSLSGCGGGGGSSAPSASDPVSQPEPDGTAEDPPDTPSYNPDDFPAATAALKQPMAVCVDRVWPAIEADYEGAQVMLVETVGNQNRAVLWRAEDGEVILESVDAASLGGEWYSSYTFGEYNGEETLGFYLNQWRGTSGDISESWWDTSIGALFHEGFHLFGQNNWHYTPGERNQTYPIQWEPRYLRAELMWALYASVVDGAPLSRAAYWYEQYLDKYTDEAAGIAYADRIEGGTEYAEYVMTALAELGCDTDETQLMDEIRDQLPQPNFRLRHVSESYDLGLFAGLLLRAGDVNLWQERVEQGETLQGILLDGVVAEAQADNPDLKEAVQAAAQQRNESLAEPIETGLAALARDDHYRLVLDSVNSVGATSGRGSYRLIDEPTFAVVDIHKSGTIHHGVDVVFDDIHFFEPEASPCYPDLHLPHVVALPKSEVSIDSAGLASANIDGVQFTDLPVEVTTDANHEWLCPLQ